ncbi:MAG: BMP family ABC transporter substrate-binding protein [Eubacteriales bacterium]|nr:BMP family ABC transporter substrate-binding protein [Eubacteriales bacterium]MDD3349720.1 BMP family ABC transporter substrate-binding protein [Eubacteriales bacterium]
MLAMTAMVGCGGDAAEETEGAADVTKIGFLYIGTITDGGYNQAQHEGTQAVEEYFGDAVEVMYAENVAEDKQAVKTNAINMIDNGASIIIGTSYGFMDGMEELATEYPEVTFLHFSGSKMNDTNFGNYFGAMEEARYLSGIVAGMTTKTDKLGYVAAFPYTEVLIGINSFYLGAKSVNPDVTMNVVYINSWGDAALEQAAAESLLAQGCDVLAQHADTSAAQTAAEKVGAYAVGYNLDNSAVAPGSFLTAPIWHHDAYLVPVIEKIIAGEYVPESYYGTIADGYIDLAPLTDLVSDEAKAKVEEVKTQIVAGDYPIFVGPLKDNKGNEVVAAGSALTERGDIWAMNWVLEGITATE